MIKINKYHTMESVVIKPGLIDDKPTIKYYYVISTKADAPIVYFYVGSTKNIDNRLKKHNSGKGSEWTKQLLKKNPDGFVMVENGIMENPLMEDYITKKYMLQHGIRHVRGGVYSAVSLHDWQLVTLEEEFKHASDKCLSCAKEGHYVNDCPTYKYMTPPTSHKKYMYCFRCGIPGHQTKECDSIRYFGSDKWRLDTPSGFIESYNPKHKW